jgi:ribosomal RNA-processing protein 8
MKDKTKYNLWTEFLEKNKIYFKIKTWYEILDEVKQFMDLNERRPSQSSKETREKYLGSWITKQLGEYNKKENGINDKKKYNTWTQFTEDYGKYFKDFDEIWYKKFEEVKKFIDTNHKTPIKESTNTTEKSLGRWFSRQKKNYKKKMDSMNDLLKYNLWTEFLKNYELYLDTNRYNWYKIFEELKLFIHINNKKPSQSGICDELKLYRWLCYQKMIYKKKSEGMKDKIRYNLWTKFTEEYLNVDKQSIVKDTQTEETEETEETKSTTTKEEETNIINKPKKSMKLKIKPSTKKEESKENKRERAKSEISLLHKDYKHLKSENLHNKFKENPKLWDTYHEISEENEKSFPEDEIPRNRIIQELNKIKTKRTKIVVDMGCGKGQISQYYKEDKRFQFHNYDHISSNDTIVSCDISNIPLEDDSVEICILSLAMWGSNCREYIQEANRILESGGKLYIIEPTRRWSEKDAQDNIIEGKEACKLKTLLEENNFQIVIKNIEKFCLFECIKI